MPEDERVGCRLRERQPLPERLGADGGDVRARQDADENG